MALKLDMSKAYNRVEWEFLRRAMLHLGYADKFVSMIMACITSVSFSVLLKGELVGNIKPSKGLKQGDPLSPYLFLVCAMWLQGLLHKAKSEGLIKGVLIVERGHVFLTYFLLMIVDDSLEISRLKVSGVDDLRVGS